MRWAGHVARMVEVIVAYSVLLGKVNLGKLGVDGSIILKCIFKK